MKQNIDFYQHYADADQHPKFKMLRAKFGWSGEGKFWALNNRIAQSENCLLDISKKYNRAAIATDLDFNLDEFGEYIEYLLQDCELVKEVEPGVITTEIVQENFEKVTAEREKARERSQRRWEKTREPSPEKKKSSGEKVSKGKERKVKEIKEDPLFNFLKTKISENGLANHHNKLIEFYEYRMAKPKDKRYKTEKGITGLLRECKKCQEVFADLNECLDITMEREWQTPDPEYLKGKVKPIDEQKTHFDPEEEKKKLEDACS